METSRNLDFVTRRRARLSWRLEAHLAADRIRAVLMGSACLWKLCGCLLRVLGTDQPVACDGIAIRWNVRVASIA